MLTGGQCCRHELAFPDDACVGASHCVDVERRGGRLKAVREAAPRQSRRVTRGIEDRPGYLATQVADESHREVLGLLLPGSGASGVVVHRGWVIAQWEIRACRRWSSARPRASCPWSPESRSTGAAGRVGPGCGDCRPSGVRDLIRPGDHLGHLLQQTSQWVGELWGKPTRVDAQSRRESTEAEGDAPGSGWAYYDLRVNLLCLALIATLRRPLPIVLGERLLDPLGASSSWSWHGCANAVADIDGDHVPVVTGGAHRYGGLWMSANDLTLLGELYLCRGRWDGRPLLSEEWIQRSWEPCQFMADYGYLW